MAALPGSAKTQSWHGRLARAFQGRVRAAGLARDAHWPEPTTNGDAPSLDRVASYSKGLPHDRLGEVDAAAFELLLRAIRSGKPQDFESIPLGGFSKLANPQAALAFELIGPDSSQPQAAAPPRFAAAEQAGEMVELYWQALCRDIPFAEYGDWPLVQSACEDLSRLSAFPAPKEQGRVTFATMFRGPFAGDLVGPYVSQFLWQDLILTPLRVPQRIRTAVAGVDYLTSYDSWLAIQNGALGEVNRFDQTPRYIRNGRDLGEYVHRDFTYQAFLGACLGAIKMGAPADGGNPYKHSRTQSAFATFGQPFLLYLLAVVTQAALKACWYQKWMVHRRLRPEEFGGRVDNHLRGAAAYPLHADLLQAGALAATRDRHGSWLLPQAYPEGCPLHPSYPAGHAVIAGACATGLKACFDESYRLPSPVVASADGLSLAPYVGPDLTLGNELDKLASNVAFGRNFAGIHWRSDAEAGLRLGEEIAIAVLRELSLTGSEIFSGWSLRRFDGSRFTVR